MKKETEIYEDNAGGLHFVTSVDSTITEYGYVDRPSHNAVIEKLLAAYHNGMSDWSSFAGIDGNNSGDCDHETGEQLTANDYVGDIEPDSIDYKLIASYDGEVIVIYPKNCGENAGKLVGFDRNDYF